VAAFILANLYSLQPYAYDNVKLLYYVYLFTYLFAGYFGLKLIRRVKLAALPIALLAGLIATSGALAVVREFQYQDQFASPNDIELASWVKRSTLPGDVFVTTDRPNQPIATLAGRPIVLGYRGWLYNYHLGYQPRAEAVQAALLGQAGPAEAYGAKYLAVATYEPADWTVDLQALSEHYKVAYANTDWTVYRLP